MAQRDLHDPDILKEGGLVGAHVPMNEREAKHALVREFGVHGQLTRLVTEKDDTFAVIGDDGARYVLKVANPAEPAAELDFQLQFIEHVRRRDPSIPVPRVFHNARHELFSQVTDNAEQPRSVSLLEYLEGTPLDRTSCSAAERRRIGSLLARLQLATSDFSHPADSRLLAWDVRHAPALRPLLAKVKDAQRRRRLAAGLERFETLHPRVLRLRTQVLHNDFSLSNIIVDHADPRFVTGIIDFGDVVRTAVAVDVATALLNQLPRTASRDAPLFAEASDLLRGYLSVAELTEEELLLLPHLVMARVVVRALIATWRAQLFPHNATYIRRNSQYGWGQLDWFLARSVDEVSAEFAPAC